MKINLQEPQKLFKSLSSILHPAQSGTNSNTSIFASLRLIQLSFFWMTESNYATDKQKPDLKSIVTVILSI